MFMPDHLRNFLRASGFVCLCTVLMLLATGAVQSSPKLGRALDADQINAMPRHVFADGRGLPEGSGDTITGSELYASHCAGCHGNLGQGGSAMELVGDRSLLTTEYPDKGIAVYWPYAPTLFEYIWRAMPPERPYSLQPDEVYAIVARVLELNGLIDSGQLVDATFLKDVQMPNKNGFRSLVD